MANFLITIFVLLLIVGWIANIIKASFHTAHFVQKKYQKFVEEQENKKGTQYIPPQSKTNFTVSNEELKSLYHKLIRKYHPDLATSQEDKGFRTFLTAKINKAYSDRDFKLLSLFD